LESLLLEVQGHPGSSAPNVPERMEAGQLLVALKKESQSAEAVINAMASFNAGLQRLRRLDVGKKAQNNDTVSDQLNTSKRNKLANEDAWMSFRR
jgi:hypothetical protein